MTRTVNGFSPFGSSPALWTSNRSPAYLRRKASAIWLRAELPLQRNRTLVVILLSLIGQNQFDCIFTRRRAGCQSKNGRKAQF
jgi:hypothetical protein